MMEWAHKARIFLQWCLTRLPMYKNVFYFNVIYAKIYKLRIIYYKYDDDSLGNSKGYGSAIQPI